MFGWRQKSVRFSYHSSDAVHELAPKRNRTRAGAGDVHLPLGNLRRLMRMGGDQRDDRRASGRAWRPRTARRRRTRRRSASSRSSANSNRARRERRTGSALSQLLHEVSGASMLLWLWP